MVSINLVFNRVVVFTRNKSEKKHTINEFSEDRKPKMCAKHVLSIYWMNAQKNLCFVLRAPSQQNVVAKRLLKCNDANQSIDNDETIKMMYGLDESV